MKRVMITAKIGPRKVAATVAQPNIADEFSTGRLPAVSALARLALLMQLIDVDQPP
jgi:hypothetical protein